MEESKVNGQVCQVHVHAMKKRENILNIIYHNLSILTKRSIEYKLDTLNFFYLVLKQNVHYVSSIK